MAEDTWAKLGDQNWRLQHLYKIVDKHGKQIPFKPNWAQADLLVRRWHRNCILKARQLGMSTVIGIFILDYCLFNDKVGAGIVCDTLDNAKGLLKRINKSYHALPSAIQKAVPLNVASTTEIEFANGSSIKVGTSLRSTTVQILHVSELGKTAVRYPDKAREIMTGALNTVDKNGIIFIESTAEGRDGVFYDLCMEAQALEDLDTKLSPMDWRFHFFPWFEHPDYELDSSVARDADVEQYFSDLECEHGITLTEPKKNWYARTLMTQKEYMKREYPSTPDEAFEHGSEGLYYNKLLTAARQAKRITGVPHDFHAPVFTAWDLGIGDSTAIWWAQLVGKEIHFIDYYENQGEALPHYLKVVDDKARLLNYQYKAHFAPHDIQQRELTSGETRMAVARRLGVSFIVIPNIGVDEGIESVRALLSNCWFDESKCAKGLRHLEAYRRQWDNKNGCFKNAPVHDEASHCADAMRYMALGLSRFARGGDNEEYKQKIRQLRQAAIS